METLPRLKANGANFVSLTLCSDAESQIDVVRKIGRERHYLRDPRYKLVSTVQDIRAAKDRGQLAVNFNLQGTNALGGDLNMIELYWVLGVRAIILAYNKKNMVGDGCHERNDGGLSLFGIEVVEEMNRVGMIIDLSHTSYKTSMDAIEVTTRPIMFSHSNPRALFDHDRNIRDDQAKAAAATGGIVGVNGVGIFMGNNDSSTAMLFKQIDYYSELIGPSHIALGLDYVYDADEMRDYMRRVKSPARGNYENMTAYFTPEQLPELTETMLAKGYAEKEVRGILGENFLRFADLVWN